MNRIYSSAKLSLLVVFSIVLSGCTLHFSMPAESPMHLSVYQSNQLIFESAVDLTDPTVIAINDWLSGHSRGWTLGLMTRAPEIYLKGKEFYINVSKRDVSVKYCIKTKYNCNLWIKKDAELFVELQKKLHQQHMPHG